MKEEPFIKLNWLVYKKEILKNMPLLTDEDPKKIYQNARALYKQELAQLAEYGPNDVLKLNLVHAVMLYALYASCPVKPDVNALRQFYRNMVLKPKLARMFLRRADATSEKRIRHQIENAEKSQHATHPYTWQYTVSNVGDRRYTATFTRCGIYDYFKAKGHPELVPAMCLMDYAFCEVQGHVFLRKGTIASGAGACDCTYIAKEIATPADFRASENDRKVEALRGGVTA